MEDKIYKEIKEVRLLLSKLIGTSDLPEKQKFSTEALDKAAVEFKNLSTILVLNFHCYQIYASRDNKRSYL